MLIAEITAGLFAAAVAATLLWWLRLRGVVVVVAWAIAAAGLATMTLLPVRHDGVVQDGEWQTSARALDSVAFALGGVERGTMPTQDSLSAISPTLWDASTLQHALAEGGEPPPVSRGFISVAGREVPVWFATRSLRGAAPELLAVSDAAVSGSGGPLTWREGDSTSQPGLRRYRELPLHSVRPGGPVIELATGGPGVELSSWPRRMMLAWALQAPMAWRRSAGDHLVLRLDPLDRLNRVIPFVTWTNLRPIALNSGVMWISDGISTGWIFPSSRRVTWGSGTAAMVRQTLTATVDAASGRVNVFRWSDSDSLSAALARIYRPLIRPAAELPPELRQSASYPGELLLAQAEVMTGPAWRVGRIDGAVAESSLSPSVGGVSAVVTFKAPAPASGLVVALVGRRTRQGDSLLLVRFDSAHAAMTRDAAAEQWDRLPFQFGVRDSVRAVKDSFEVGRVRYQFSREGLIAYQPAWSVDSLRHARLAIVNVAIGGKLGTGRSWNEAWRNYRNEVSPLAVGVGAAAVLDQARLWMRRADSALKRGDLPEFDKALANLREILEPTGRKP